MILRDVPPPDHRLEQRLPRDSVDAAATAALFVQLLVALEVHAVHAGDERFLGSVALRPVLVHADVGREGALVLGGKRRRHVPKMKAQE